MADAPPAENERAQRAPRTAKAGFTDIVVVCAKCAKRQGLPKREAGRRIKRALRQVRPGCEARVVTTGCLGPCPKHLIAVATPATLAARRLMLLDPELSPEAVADLLPDFGRKA